MASLKITYADGSSTTVRLTAFDNMRAEEKTQKEGWNFGGVRASMYAVYSNLRARGKTTLPFDKWAADVVETESVEEEPGESATVPAGPTED